MTITGSTLTSGTSASGDTGLTAGELITATDSTVKALAGSVTLESTGAGETLTGTVVSAAGATPSSVSLLADKGDLQIAYDSANKVVGSVTAATNVTATSTTGALTINDVPLTATSGTETLGSAGNALIENLASVSSGTGTTGTFGGTLTITTSTLTSGNSAAGNTGLTAGGLITGTDSTIKALDGSVTLESTGAGETLSGTVVSAAGATPSSVSLLADKGDLQIAYDTVNKVAGSVTAATNVTATSTTGALTINDVPLTATSGTETLGSAGNALIENGATLSSGTGTTGTFTGTLTITGSTLTSGTSASGDTGLTAGGLITGTDSTVKALAGSVTLESTGAGETLTGTVVSAAGATPSSVSLLADKGDLQIA